MRSHARIGDHGTLLLEKASQNRGCSGLAAAAKTGLDKMQQSRYVILVLFYDVDGYRRVIVRLQQGMQLA